MKTIETVITVLPDGSIQVPPRTDLPPGAHRAVIVLESVAQPAPAPNTLLKLKMLDWSGWPADSTYRREDLYSDFARFASLITIVPLVSGDAKV